MKISATKRGRNEIRNSVMVVQTEKAMGQVRSNLFWADKEHRFVKSPEARKLIQTTLKRLEL
jgi:hypothetical protein